MPIASSTVACSAARRPVFRIRRVVTLVALVFGFVLGPSGRSPWMARAEAAAWMFCVISSDDYLRVWISEAFDAVRSREEVERIVVANARRILGIQVVAQCPLPSADRRTIEADRQIAIEFNRRRNRTFADFSGLMPTD